MFKDEPARRLFSQHTGISGATIDGPFYDDELLDAIAHEFEDRRAQFERRLSQALI
jgi:hypothetical protein